jgi:folate-dependent tRNA-U54 methylase TrmFO/GidA
LTFIVQDGDGIRITAASGDTIRIAGTVTAAAGYVESTTIGNTVTLVAINATEWMATAVNGTWTFGP